MFWRREVFDRGVRDAGDEDARRRHDLSVGGGLGFDVADDDVLSEPTGFF
jgi:hypothetical protein